MLLQERPSNAMLVLRTASVVCRWLIVAALAGHLIFAHGCHGDEDHELFGAIQRATDPPVNEPET